MRGAPRWAATHVGAASWQSAACAPGSCYVTPSDEAIGPNSPPLSRDHHQALEAALRLRRASDESLGEAIEYFLAFWSQHGEHHFVIEERLLLPPCQMTC